MIKITKNKDKIYVHTTENLRELEALQKIGVIKIEKITTTKVEYKDFPFQYYTVWHYTIKIINSHLLSELATFLMRFLKETDRLLYNFVNAY